MTLTGNDSVAAYQEALRTVKFNNTTDTPDTTNRSIEWNVVDSSDGTLASAGTSTVSVTAVNDAPALAGGGNVHQFSEGDSAIVVNNSLTLSDPEATVVNRVEVVLAGAGSGEQLNFTDTSKIEGSWSSGTLTLSAINLQSPTNAEFQAAIRTITYSNTDTSTTDGNRTATFTAYEGTGTGLASSTAVTTISVATLDDDAPTLGGLSGSAVAYTESAAATQLESGLTVADTDDDDLEKAIVRISAGFADWGRCACCDRWFDRFNGDIHSIHWNIRNYGNWHEG